MNVFDLNLEEGEQRRGSMLLGMDRKRVDGVLHRKNGNLHFSYKKTKEWDKVGAGIVVLDHNGAWFLKKNNTDFDPNSFTSAITPPKFKPGDRVVETATGRQITNTCEPYMIGSIGTYVDRKWVVVSSVYGDGMWWYTVRNGAGELFDNRISEDGLKLEETETLQELDGFKVGEVVRIKKWGSGFNPDTEVGKTVTITDLGAGKYAGNNGARIKESLGNQKSGMYDRWVGLDSFEKISMSNPFGKAMEDEMSKDRTPPTITPAMSNSYIGSIDLSYSNSVVKMMKYYSGADVPIEGGRGILDFITKKYPTKSATSRPENTYHQVPVLVRKVKNKSKLLTI